jgi:hypothetical protein
LCNTNILTLWDKIVYSIFVSLREVGKYPNSSHDEAATNMASPQIKLPKSLKESWVKAIKTLMNIYQDALIWNKIFLISSLVTGVVMASLSSNGTLLWISSRNGSQTPLLAMKNTSK